MTVVNHLCYTMGVDGGQAPVKYERRYDMFNDYRIKYWDGEKLHTVVRNDVGLLEACTKLANEKFYELHRFIDIKSAKVVIHKR
ncbi:MAG: hypothetical protein MJZ81_07655 [Bacteroidales bacterium]|nr:hypothetical protein [Bacteroidales bacterium]